MALDGTRLKDALEAIAAEMATVEERGKPADYIPELARVSAGHFALCVATEDGRLFSCGDADTAFSIQSVSKVFTLTLALGLAGDALWKRVGREPSGSAFNSIVQLEYEHGRPRNPFINAGAIAVTDIILGNHQPREALGEILRFLRALSGDDTISIDEAVALSEKQTGYRNFALANYMRAYGIITHPVDLVLGVYFHHCAIAMTAQQLAQAGSFLAFGGRDPLSGFRVVSPDRARRINALMLTCGHYDGSGEFAYRVGLPAKSGVGGGILCIVPGVASIAAWSPGLNDVGNSRLGTLALERLAKTMDWNIFGIRS